MLYILWGEDDFSLTKALEDIKSSTSDPEMLAANTTVLDGARISPEELAMVVATVPFLAERRLVVVRGLLSRFEPVKGAGAGKTKKAPKAAYKEFAGALDSVPESTIAVLTDSKLSSSNSLMKALSAKATVRAFPRLRKNDLGRWIDKGVKGRGGTISPRAVSILVDLVGPDLWVMDGELEKLSLFAEGRCIEAEDVEAMVSRVRDINVFAMVDAVVEGKVRSAGHSLHQLLSQGASPMYIMAMLSRQVRLMMLAKMLWEEGVPDGEMGRRLGIGHEFALRKTLQQARGYPLERLKALYRRLLETDLAIKTGRYDAELALRMLLADMCPGG